MIGAESLWNTHNSPKRILLKSWTPFKHFVNIVTLTSTEWNSSTNHYRRGMMVSLNPCNLFFSILRAASIDLIRLFIKLFVNHEFLIRLNTVACPFLTHQQRSFFVLSQPTASKPGVSMCVLDLCYSWRWRFSQVITDIHLAVVSKHNTLHVEVVLLNLARNSFLRVGVLTVLDQPSIGLSLEPDNIAQWTNLISISRETIIVPRFRNFDFHTCEMYSWQ